MHWKFTESTYYRKIMDDWQKPLERKKIRQQRRLENPVIPNEENPTPSVYVHEPEEGVELPPNPS